MSAKFVVPLVVGLSGLSAAAYMLYILLKKDEDELGPHIHRIRTSRPTVIEVKIPKNSVGVVIGRGGSSIQSIQEKTDTKINFKDEAETDEYRVCIIRGTSEGAQLAETLIHDKILNQPLIETYETYVPQHACGRIIGRCGENIRSISRAANANIFIDPYSNSNELQATRRVVIKGTAEQIAVAKSLIEEKVAEDLEMREKIQETLEKRSPRKKNDPLYLLSAEAVQEEQSKRHNTESLIATGKDGFMEVYVSAVENPEHFWVQVIGPRAVELDHLVEEMTEFYRLEENREFHVIKKITVDQLVAAPFSHDDKWYRARVIGVNLDDYDVEESQINLYYLDYGDSDSRLKKEVYSLRADFLKLRYQAIECSLAKVKPRGDAWADEATDLFEDLCHVAQWRVLMSRVDSYKDRERGRREGSPIPVVELYDTSGVQDICVAEELVKQGYAVWEKKLEEQQAPKKQQGGGNNVSLSATESSAAKLTAQEMNKMAAGDSNSSKSNESFIDAEKKGVSNQRTKYKQIVQPERDEMSGSDDMEMG